MSLYRCPVLLALVCSLLNTILNFHKRLAHKSGHKRGKTGVPIIIVCITLLKSLAIKTYICAYFTSKPNIHMYDKKLTLY